MDSRGIVRSVIIPCGNQKLVLPNAAIAEVIRYKDPIDVPDSPSWLLGVMPWRRQTVPVISFENVCGEKPSMLGFQTRLVICYCISGKPSQIQFFSIVAKVTPTLLRVTTDNITHDKDREVTCPVSLSPVTVSGISAAIPNLLVLEDMVQEFDAQMRNIIDTLPEHYESDIEAKPKTTPKKLILDDIEEDIVEIFIEEAQENIEAINEYYTRWKNNQADNDALTNFRRAFHTIKGSGRMVKVDFISEAAWSVENMLNRYIDHSIQVSPEFIAHIDDVVEKLPLLMECFIQRIYPNIDIQTIIETGHAISRGEKPSVEITQQPTTESITADTDTTIIEAPATSQYPHEYLDKNQEIDEEILEIFADEGRELIDDIDTHFQAWRVTPDDSNEIASLQRALHTFKGGARLVGLSLIGHISHAMENMLTALIDKEIEMSDHILNVTQKTSDTMAEMFESVMNGVIPENDKGLIYQIDQITSVGASAEIQPDATPAAPVATPEHSIPVSEEVDDLDEELVEIFLEEGDELIEMMETNLRAWKDDYHNATVINELHRALHTIKGGARLSGIMPIGDLAHTIESMLSAIGEQILAVDDHIYDLTMKAYDALANDMEKVKNQETLDNHDEFISEIEGIIAKAKH